MQAGTSHFPYTWADCEFRYAILTHKHGANRINTCVQAGTSHFPYTWADCEFRYAVLAHKAGTYCNGNDPHNPDCESYNPDSGTLRQIAESPSHPTVFELFAEFPAQWDLYFNRGMTKLTMVGANWGENVVRPLSPPYCCVFLTNLLVFRPLSPPCCCVFLIKSRRRAPLEIRDLQLLVSDQIPSL